MQERLLYNFRIHSRYVHWARRRGQGFTIMMCFRFEEYGIEAMEDGQSCNGLHRNKVEIWNVAPQTGIRFRDGRRSSSSWITTRAWFYRAGNV